MGRPKQKEPVFWEMMQGIDAGVLLEVTPGSQ
jgi:hypothetical protein